MSDALFLANITEDQEWEAKKALGRDGQGQLPESFWETYSAFANTDGGTVLLGVEEKDGEFSGVGIPQPDRVEDQLWALLNNRKKVSHNLLTRGDVIRHPWGEGRWIVAVKVPRASRKSKPIYLGENPYEATFKRNHSGDFRCSREEIDGMIAERVEDSRDTRILPHHTLADLSMESLTTYRQRLANLKPDHPYNDLKPEDFLQKIGGWAKNRETGEEGLTIAGLLMFGQSELIQEVLPNYFLDYRELPTSGSKTEWTDRLVPDGSWSGNIYDFYRQVINRLFSGIKVPLSFQGEYREDDTPLHSALREALVNCLIHAEYQGRACILVVKAPDYFGFRNPGHMRVPLADALEGGKSDSRNRTLQKMFSLVGLGEQAGSGIPRILKRWGELSFRQPELWEANDPSSTLMRMRMVSLLPPESMEALAKIFGDGFERLSHLEKMALVTAEVEGEVSNQRLQQITREHPIELTKMFQGLVSNGFLSPSGRGRGTTYSVVGLASDNLETSSDNFNASSGNFDASSGNFDASSDNLETSSDNLETSSDNLETSSDNLETSSDNFDASSDNFESSSGELDQSKWGELMKLSEGIRESSWSQKEVVRPIILKLCLHRYLTKEQLGKLLDREPRNLRQNFLKPLTNEGLLELRYPDTTTHHEQAYRTVKEMPDL